LTFNVLAYAKTSTNTSVTLPPLYLLSKKSGAEN